MYKSDAELLIILHVYGYKFWLLESNEAENQFVGFVKNVLGLKI